MSNSSQKEAGRAIFTSSVFGLANTTAAVTTFFGVPPLHSKTVSFVQAYTENHYGTGLDDLVGFAWFVVCAFFVFFVSRASVATLLVMGGLALAARLF